MLILKGELYVLTWKKSQNIFMNEKHKFQNGMFTNIPFMFK